MDVSFRSWIYCSDLGSDEGWVLAFGGDCTCWRIIPPAPGRVREEAQPRHRLYFRKCSTLFSQQSPLPLFLPSHTHVPPTLPSTDYKKVVVTHLLAAWLQISCPPSEALASSAECTLDKESGRDVLPKEQTSLWLIHRSYINNDIGYMSRSARIANFVSFRLIEMRLLSCYIPFLLVLHSHFQP